MPEPSLFHGIAVVIDDEIDVAGSGILKLKSQIEAAGCHVVPMSKLPESASIVNLREVAFFILDWNLYGQSLKVGSEQVTVTPPASLKKQNALNAIAFLKKLKEVCVAPVFVFTNEDVTEVEEQLKTHAELHNTGDPSYILVKNKGDVTETGIFEVLSQWMKKAPSVYVLKKWERSYTSAKNELFRDFYTKSVHWPLVLWDTYKEDNIPPSTELGNVIGRNLLSRMTPFTFDLGPFDGAYRAAAGDEGKSRDAVIKVLEGERFLAKDRLHGNMLAPGDVFKTGGDFYVNIRPECDCIAREGLAQAEVMAYLLKGSKVTNAAVLKRLAPKYGTLSESDSENVVFGMIGGVTVSFQFGTLLVEASGEWMAKRIGRLLPPYLTRLQQRYAAYLQRPGLSRIPKAALPVIIPPINLNAAPPAAPAAPAPKVAVPKRISLNSVTLKPRKKTAVRKARSRPSTKQGHS
jgi:hypothetical protein